MCRARTEAARRPLAPVLLCLMTGALLVGAACFSATCRAPATPTVHRIGAESLPDAELQSLRRFYGRLAEGYAPAASRAGIRADFPRFIFYSSMTDFETSLARRLQAANRIAPDQARELAASLKVRAYFASRENVVHAPLPEPQDSPAAFRATLRHELVHAFVFAARSDTPYWLQEGLARFFEHPEAPTPSRDCARVQKPRLADEMRAALPELQRRVKTRGLAPWRTEAPDAWLAPQSTYRLVYLWERRRLGDFLRAWFAGTGTLDAATPDEAAFARWLQSPAAATPGPGC